MLMGFMARIYHRPAACQNCGGELLLCRRVKFWRRFFNEASGFRNT
jgi:hypothetical protein